MAKPKPLYPALPERNDSVEYRTMPDQHNGASRTVVLPPIVKRPGSSFGRIMPMPSMASENNGRVPNVMLRPMSELYPNEDIDPGWGYYAIVGDAEPKARKENTSSAVPRSNETTLSHEEPKRRLFAGLGITDEQDSVTSDRTDRLNQHLA